MKIHQQRVPIISPLDRDYHRRSSTGDTSINSFSSFKDVASNSVKAGLQDSGESPLQNKDILLFTIVGERDL